MKVSKSIFVILFFIVFLEAKHLSLSHDEKLYIKNNPVLKVQSSSSLPPFNYREENRAYGYTIDYMRLMGKYIGVKMEFIDNKTWSEQLDMLAEGSLDIMPHIAVNDERRKFIEFTDFNHIEYLIGFATRRSLHIQSFADLKDKTIAVSKKSFLQSFLKNKYPDTELIVTNSTEQAIEMLASNRVDAVIGNVPSMEYYIQKNWFNGIKTIIVDDLGIEKKVKLPMGVRKGNLLLKSILEKAEHAIPHNEIVKLKNKWLYVNHKTIQLGLTSEEKQYLQNKAVLRVQNLETFPPFNFNENDTPYGYTIDYMSLLAKYMGVEIEFVSNKSWGAYLDMLKDDTLDIIPHIAVNEERKKFIDYTNFTHIEYVSGLAIRKNSNIKSINDLKDKIIAVANKTFLHNYLKKNFPKQSLLLTESTAKAIYAVSNGKADAVIGSLPALDYYIQKDWLTNVKTINVSDLGLPNKTKLPMGVKKGNTLLKSILEKVNANISRSEVIKLKEKWINIEKTLNVISTSLSDKELSYLDNKKVIKMCVLPNWLPFEQIDEYNKHKGIGSDIMKLVSEYIDTPIELLPTKEWSESLQNLIDRKCDILPMAMDVPTRRDTMNFTKPFVSEPFVVTTTNDKFFIKDIEDLSGKKVGIVKSYAFVEVLKDKNPLIEVVEVKNTKDGLERLSKGELFAYVDTMPTVGYFIQKHGFFDLKVAGKLSYDIELSVASRNDEPELNSIMQKALDSISKDQIRTIVGKWMAIQVRQEYNYKLIWQISVVFVLIILAILYWNRSMSKMNKKLRKAHHEINDQQKMVDKYVLILATDTNGIITEVNQAYCDLIGFKKDELIGKNHTCMKHPDMSKEIFDDMWSTITQDKAWRGEIKNLSKDNEIVWFNMNVEPIFQDGVKIGYRSISENITNKKKIEELSITDKLTGLYNRMKLDEILNMKIKEYKRYEKSFSVIILDVDNFKDVNDTYGHDVGDKVLIRLSDVLALNMRTTDYVGRWGGEEFVVICENTKLEGAYTLAEHLRKLIEEIKFEVIGYKTISLGVAEVQKGDTISSIFKKVDIALYEAKKTGKNKTIRYEEF